MDRTPSIPSRSRPACPHCGRPGPRPLGYVRFAVSSFILPVTCALCGARYYLSYHPAVFLLLWMFLCPLYLVALLYLAMLALPTGAVIPAFIAAAVLSLLWLPLLGVTRLKSRPPA
jgi:hypothetical protein